MEPREFLDTARYLIQGPRESDWRSSISRAYYSVFHIFCGVFRDNVERRLLRRPGQGNPNHDFIIRCLRNCGNREVAHIGFLMRRLWLQRKDSDYDLQCSVERADAEHAVGQAEDISRGIEGLTAARIASAVSGLLAASPYGYPPP